MLPAAERGKELAVMRDDVERLAVRGQTTDELVELLEARDRGIVLQRRIDGESRSAAQREGKSGGGGHADEAAAPAAA